MRDDATAEAKEDLPPSPATSVQDASSLSSKSPLLGPHQDIIAQLQPNHTVLAASVLSSTQIHKRVSQILSHLAKEGKPVVLLHARPKDVCKMITIVEQSKRLLGGEGRSWVQYNQLFEPPETRTVDVVEETVLRENSSDDEDFEPMAQRFEQAITATAPEKKVLSMRIFLCAQAVPELRGREGVTSTSS